MNRRAPKVIWRRCIQTCTNKSKTEKVWDQGGFRARNASVTVRAGVGIRVGHGSSPPCRSTRSRLLAQAESGCDPATNRRRTGWRDLVGRRDPTATAELPYRCGMLGLKAQRVRPQPCACQSRRCRRATTETWRPSLRLWKSAVRVTITAMALPPHCCMVLRRLIGWLWLTLTRRPRASRAARND